MDYNTYNINVNFISDPKKYLQNGYFGSMKYINYKEDKLKKEFIKTLFNILKKYNLV